MPQRQPNVLFIIMDDQRFDTIAALGNGAIRTPNLDRLVRRGTAFTHACLPGGLSQAVCVPSRAMIMTGRTPFHLSNHGGTLPAQDLTLPQILRSGGYTTYHVGKWHHDRASFARSYDGGARIFAFGRGWYEAYGGHWNVPVHDFDPTGAYPPDDAYIAAGPDGNLRRPVSRDVTDGRHDTDLYADAAIEFIRDAKGPKPFFLYLAFTAPHDPRQSPPEYLAMYPPASLKPPANFLPQHPFDNGEMSVRDEMLEALPRTPMAIQRHLSDYYAMITHADARIGHVLDALEQQGLADDTIVIFTADHGLAVGQHGLLGKQNLYDHSVRVPLLLSGPGLPRGQRRDGLCRQMDLMATLCEMVGLPAAPNNEGSSLLPMLRDDRARIHASVPLAYRHLQRGVRDERFKLIEYVVEGLRTTQLFDLLADPLEMRNLAEQLKWADELARMRRELRRWRDVFDDTKHNDGKIFWDGYGQT